MLIRPRENSEYALGMNAKQMQIDAADKSRLEVAALNDSNGSEEHQCGRTQTGEYCEPGEGAGEKVGGSIDGKAAGYQTPKIEAAEPGVKQGRGQKDEADGKR